MYRLLLLSVGYAWLPLLKDGRVITNDNHIPVTTSLPAGYLSCQENANKVEPLPQLLGGDDCAFVLFFSILPFSSQHSGPEVKWVDGGKPLFKVSTHLVSTVYTQVGFCLFVLVS